LAQFRVEFVLDPATGKYLAELYNPDNAQELLARTDALYQSQAAAVLGLIDLFKGALPKSLLPTSGRRSSRKHHADALPRKRNLLLEERASGQRAGRLHDDTQLLPKVEHCAQSSPSLTVSMSSTY